jgi:hypothetical protein
VVPMDDRRAGKHAFNERGGTCDKCGMTWNAFGVGTASGISKYAPVKNLSNESA